MHRSYKSVAQLGTGTRQFETSPHIESRQVDGFASVLSILDDRIMAQRLPYHKRKSAETLPSRKEV